MYDFSQGNLPHHMLDEFDSKHIVSTAHFRLWLLAGLFWVVTPIIHRVYNTFIIFVNREN